MKTELFRHEKYIKQQKSPKTKRWSFKVFIPFEQNGENNVYTKTFNESKFESPKEAFENAIKDRNEALVLIKNLEMPKKTSLTVSDVLDKTFETSSMSAETIRKKRSTFNKWTNCNLRLKKIVDVSSMDIQESLSIASRNANISQSILDHLFTIWGQIFKTAMKMDLLIKNPFDRVDKLKINKVVKDKRISETDLETLLKVCDAIITHTKNTAPQKYDALLLTYALKISWFTALRPAEVLGLEYKHIDLNSRIIKVRQEVGLDENRNSFIRSTKTDLSNRDVPITDELADLLKELLAIQKHEKYLFADYYGKLMSSTKTADKIGKSCKLENIKFNWYCLRHQYSTDMERLNLPISITAKSMGHKNINMTYGYTRMNENDIRSSVNLLSRTLKI